MMVSTPVLWSVITTVVFVMSCLGLNSQGGGPGGAIPWTLAVFISGFGMFAAYIFTIASWL